MDGRPWKKRPAEPFVSKADLRDHLKARVGEVEAQKAFFEGHKVLCLVRLCVGLRKVLAVPLPVRRGVPYKFA